MNFEQFLMTEYQLGESSAKDYVGQLDGILKKGIYNGENIMTPSIEAAIEEEYPNSKKHYKLILNRYFAFRDMIMNG